jgi:hypothetical protein
LKTQKLKVDYLVVGSGAMGMAFTDTLMSETDATVAIVDKHHRPGGHWNDAYPFVRLHQPSAFYGVNSKPLGDDQIDQVGLNAGLFELASGAEVCAYFDQVMQRQFLPSGRVQYFPMCEYREGEPIRSIISDQQFEIEAERAIVDATYMNVSVPSVREPRYEVASEVQIAPLNDLPRLPRPASGYVIVGAGKTGMDACLWLLTNGVEPDSITWIMPRDSWLLDRAYFQPDQSAGGGSFAGQFDCIARSSSIHEAFELLDEAGQLLRLSEDVWPSMYRCATVTKAELEQLRRVQNVVRMGRVQRIEPEQVVLDEGVLANDPGKLFVDCSADGLEQRPVVPIFAADRITLQTVRPCQQVFSAAFIGHVEASRTDEAEKNALCTVTPHPNTDQDFLRMTYAMAMSQISWMQDAEISEWLSSARLNLAREGSTRSTSPDAGTAMTAISKLTEYLQELDGGVAGSGAPH